MSPITSARERREIPLALIDDPQLPSRTAMDEEKLTDLVASIRARGFWSVLVVVRRGDRFEVVAGHRRTMAARQVGLVAVPCVICEPDDPDIEAIQFDENAKREDLSVTDEAIWFRDLLQRYPEGGTDGVAARTGNTRAYVERRLVLLDGCPRVFAALAAGDLKVGAAEKLNEVTEDAHRYMLLDMAVRGGATVGLIGQWVREWKTVHLPATGGAPLPAPTSSGIANVANDWTRCRVCGDAGDPGNKQMLNVHDYCLRPLIDPATGLFRSRADYVEFPRTRDAAVALAQRIIERFPEIAE